MLLIIVVSSFFIAFEFLSVVGKFSPKWLKRVLGYEWVIDVTLSFGMMAWFATTGAIMGIIISAISGFIFSVVLYAAKHIVGYAKLVKVPGQWKWYWVEHAGSWSWKKSGGVLGGFSRGVVRAFKAMAGGFIDAAKAPANDAVYANAQAA